jgi:hypothetical protein
MLRDVRVGHVAAEGLPGVRRAWRWTTLLENDATAVGALCFLVGALTLLPGEEPAGRPAATGPSSPDSGDDAAGGPT